MKTQGTKLVARIAMALLAGMMVLALASCGNKNPLKGHTYEGKIDGTDEVFTFAEKECKLISYDGTDYEDEKTCSYTLNSESLTGTIYFGGEEVSFSYREDGSSISVVGTTCKKVK
mgnify:CR=1 FL=1